MDNIWNFQSLEAIRAAFSAPEIRAVSFDFFDTLVTRPLGDPGQLFDLLDRRFAEISSCSAGFRKLRTEAEAVLRRRVLQNPEMPEDFPLEDIYRVLKEDFGLEEETARVMMEEERRAEIRFSEPRKTGIRLMKEAAAAGKKVVILSDMYLGTGDLEKIAARCGVPQAPIYVSSETGKRKQTGSLYGYAARELGIRPSELFHIGDNEEIDCRQAVLAGCRAALLPAASAAFERCGCAHQAEKICRDLTDWQAACRSPGLMIARKMAANCYFDDPFRPFAPDSDYNGDPFFAGYAALGPEILAVVRWLSDEVRRDGIKKLLFASRDGYLPMMAYELYRRYHPELPSAGYLRISRLSMLPLMISAPADLFDLPMDVRRQTPRKLFRMLRFLRAGEADGIPAEDDFPGDPDDFFTPESCHEWILRFIRNYYDPEAHSHARRRAADYLRFNAEAPVTEGAGLFDMGYSGRTAAAAAEGAGVFLPVYYFQTDPAEHFRLQDRGRIRIRSFLDFSPYMEASFREYAFLEPSASCVGYTEDRQPVFDGGPAPGYGRTAEAMQEGAICFLEDYMERFSDHEGMTLFRGHDAAMPFEAFLRFCAPEDMKMFSDVLLDDEMWGGRRNISLPGLVQARLRKLPEFAGGPEKKETKG